MCHVYAPEPLLRFPHSLHEICVPQMSPQTSQARHIQTLDHHSGARTLLLLLALPPAFETHSLPCICRDHHFPPRQCPHAGPTALPKMIFSNLNQTWKFFHKAQSSSLHWVLSHYHLIRESCTDGIPTPAFVTSVCLIGQFQVPVVHTVSPGLTWVRARWAFCHE